jgi:hypothetical protein
MYGKKFSLGGMVSLRQIAQKNYRFENIQIGLGNPRLKNPEVQF